MNNKKIIRDIKRNLDSWISSINDEELRTRIKDCVVVSGGCITSLLLDEEVNDYDVYFKEKSVCVDVARYYTTFFNQGMESDLDPIIVDDTLEYNRVYLNLTQKDILTKSDILFNNNNSPYQPIFVSNNSITLEDKIQLIFRFCGDIETIHTNFDFVHCSNYYDYKTNLLHLNKEAIESILTKELMYVGSKFPLCSMIRTHKFLKKGWNINAGQYLKIAFQLNELDLYDISVLENQLTSISPAYFKNFVSTVLTDAHYNRKLTPNDLIDVIFNDPSIEDGHSS